MGHGGRRPGAGRPRGDAAKPSLPNIRAESAAKALMLPRVYEARLAGMSFSRIGRALGISTTTAFDHYTEYIAQHQHPPEEIERVRALEIERLEWQREKLVQGMEGTADPMVRARLSDAMVRVSERLARLRPIEVAQRVDVAVDARVFDEATLIAAAQTYLERRTGPPLLTAGQETPESETAEPEDA